MKNIMVAIVILMFFFIGCGEKAKVENLEKENADLKAKIDQMKEAEKKAEAIVTRNLELWNKGDMVVVDELYSADFVRNDFAIPAETKGIEAFKEVVKFNRTAYPDFTVKIKEIIVKGDRVITPWIMTGTNTGPRGDLPATGKAIKISGVSIVRIVNGKLTEELLFYDLSNVLKQLGFTLNPPANK